jgi:hypothetical protein
MSTAYDLPTSSRPATELTEVIMSTPTNTERRTRRPRKNPPIPTEPAVNFRISPEGWAEFGDGCHIMGTTRSEVLREFIAWYNHVPGAAKPKRPSLSLLQYQEDLPEQPEQPDEHHAHHGAA